jgi:preprotein translocase subunit SecE|tara:strand:+ start:1774 stop:1968 length:195 start_codon:yes stop_codon:yes gene_type:complete
MNKIINYFKSVGIELRKVSWLTKDQLINSTIIVGVFSILISLFLFILDFGLTQFVKVIFDIEIG